MFDSAAAFLHELSGRQQTQGPTSFDHRLRTALTNRSINSSSSTIVSSARPSLRAPRILCASSLTTEQLDDKLPDVDEPRPHDQLHPVLQRSSGAVLRDLVCCCPCLSRPASGVEAEVDANPDRTADPGMCLTCWRAVSSCFTPANPNTRAERYQMAETEPAAAQRFSWERERPSAANYKFANAVDATLVKRRGDIAGQQFVIENCQNSVLMVLDNLGSVTVDDCKSCVIILGPCSGSVFIRDCSDCTIFTACQQFRSRDSSIMVHLFCATSPIIEETTAQFFPLFLKYPFIEENLASSGLSPFTNCWFKVHDFTPETSQFTVSPQPKPIENTYGPAYNWLPDLKAERVSIETADSYFLFTPATCGPAEQEEQVLVFFNLPVKTEHPTRTSFYSTVNSILHRLCADPEVTRLVVAHDFDLREGELSNVLGEKTAISGKLISVELGGPPGKCREFVNGILGPVNYPGIVIQTITTDKTEVYRQNLNRLADVQSNI